MALLDANIVLISLPTIIRKLPGTSTVDALWIIMGYTLVISTTLLTVGRLGDIFGRIKLYKVGFAVFTIGSGLCSISFNGSALVFFRLVQAIGAALIFGNGTAIVTDSFPLSERGRALGISQIGGIAGSVIGLVAGGILTTTLGWPSIFWINLPIGAFSTVWANLRLKELGVMTKHERPDLIGMFVFGAGLALALIGLVFGSISSWSSFDLILLTFGVLLMCAFGYLETKIKAPMMNLDLFKIKEFSSGIIANLLATTSRGAISFVLVFYFQGVLLLDALRAGLMLIPFALAYVLVAPISGFLSDRFGSRGFATIGMIISALALLWFSTLPENVSYPILVFPMMIAGIGGGLFFSPNIASIMSSVPTNRRGIASGMSSTLINTGSLLSLGISFTILATSVPNSILQEIFAGLPVASGSIDLGKFVGAMHVVFSFMAILSGVAAVAAFLSGSKPRAFSSS
jgi:EmrB/QacA subfamily drug resistance transporter